MITNKERLTNQRLIIKNYLLKTCSHPTAEEVFHKVKKKLPQISLATVYRNLKFLTKKGDCLAIEHQGKLHFDGYIDSHPHFICQKCGQIYDCNRCFAVLKTIVNKKLKIGKVKKYQLFLYGTCKKCQRRQK